MAAVAITPVPSIGVEIEVVSVQQLGLRRLTTVLRRFGLGKVFPFQKECPIKMRGSLTGRLRLNRILFRLRLLTT
jgi:hypothetical protein